MHNKCTFFFSFFVVMKSGQYCCLDGLQICNCVGSCPEYDKELLCDRNVFWQRCALHVYSMHLRALMSA